MPQGLLYQKSNEPIVLSKHLLDLLLKEDNPAELIALYVFYYYTAKWQHTDQVRATNTYVIQGLHWGTEKIKLRKTKLVELGLIKNIIKKDQNGLFSGHYVYVNVLPSQENLHDYRSPFMESECINTLIPNSRNTTSSIEDVEESISLKHFEDFWKLYPRKDSKGYALSIWSKLCKKKERPTWIQIKKAIFAQIKSDRWQDKKFIPIASTWLNQTRWLDDPKELIKYDRNTNEQSYKTYDGRKYYLCTDGEYRNKAGDIYIE